MKIKIFSGNIDLAKKSGLTKLKILLKQRNLAKRDNFKHDNEIFKETIEIHPKNYAKFKKSQHTCYRL
jgi:hypothetical protein